jgi:outer membrane protein OmpA-like peptidoglycan-associated protein
MERTVMQRGHVIIVCGVLWLWPVLAIAQQVQVEAPQPTAAAAQPLEEPERPQPTAAAEPSEVAADQPTSHNPRAQSTWFGSSGGLRVIDGGSGEVGTFRLQLGFDYFRAGDFLVVNDIDQALSGTLSLAATPIDHLEAFASISSRSNSNNAGNPILLQVAGDVSVGAKGFFDVTPWLSLGGDLRLLFLNTVGDLGITAGGTSIGLRAAATADLRHLEQHVPVIVRANIGYLFDNSAHLVETVEDERYNSLPAATRRSPSNEDRNLVTRIERFALDINRVDMLGVGLGVEAPLHVSDDFWVHPLLEWQLGIPVNRQGYNCLSTQTGSSIRTPDGCLALTGLSAAPSTLTVGARAFPPLKGFSALLGVDIGLLGTTTFVRELAPTRPWAVILALAYTVDLREKPPIVVAAPPVAAAAPAAPKKQRIRGVVVERGFGTPIAGAMVRYPDRELSPQLTAADGSFVSYQLEPGDVIMQITHPDYEPGQCVARIAPAGAAAKPRSGLTPAGAAQAPTAAAPQPPPSAAGGREFFALARCELTARPRNAALSGTVSDAKGQPVPGATVQITGPATRSIVSGPDGSLAAQDLPAGEYTARVDAPKYFLKTQSFSVAAGTDVNLPITLVEKPKVAQVTLSAREVHIGTQVVFESNSADIAASSNSLLAEVADVLARNPQVQHVQVQGHTDNRGDPAANLELSQRRAEAVVQWLINAGVDASRLEAKGYGDTRPLVPNLTPANRARNRRVQFVITKPE